MKDYLETENVRNKEGAEVFARLIKKAFGSEQTVMVGHHVAFENPVAGLASENEIPSADTLIFDHDIMERCFGSEDYVRIMQTLVALPCSAREKVLEEIMNDRSI